MSSGVRLVKFAIATAALIAGVMTQSFGSAAIGVSLDAAPTGTLSPHLVDATTSAVADPSPTPWPNTSAIVVTTDSTGTVTFAVDPASTAAGCAVDVSGNVSSTAPGSCVIDVSVGEDGTYSPSSTSATAYFTAAATTSSVANPSSTPWSSASAIEVTTDSTGAVSYSVDPSSTAANCAVNLSGTVSATGMGSCVIDVSVAGDESYSPSTTSVTVSFTPAAAATSAVADPSSTPWSNTSAIDVTTDSTGAVSYRVDAASTATGCAVNLSGTVSATGTGTCEIDVSVAGDPNYLSSTASATVTFTAISGGGGGGGGGSTTLTQTSPTTGSVSTEASGTFTAGPLTVEGNSGMVTFVVTRSSPSLTVSSSGLVATTGTLPGGSYSVSGTDSDSHGDTGTWSYSLKVTATVTFSANGGVGSMSAEQASAPTALSLNTFTRKRYTFIDWNTTPTGTGVSYANGAVYPFAATTVLFARWKLGALPFKTITFDANGGTGRTASEVENTPTAIRANHFTRRGYVFVSWSTTAKGTGRTFAPGNTYSFKRSLALFARWKKVASKAPKPPKPPKPPKVPTHVVTFLANGGRGKMTAEVDRSPTALTSNGFRRTGYTFVGWNTAADGKGIEYTNSATYSFRLSTNLYAQWKKNVPVPLPIANGIVVGPFAAGSSSLSAGLKTQIQSLASEAKARAATQIILYGCGDEVGSTSQASVALARARAGAVATYLEARLSDEGLKGWTISITTASPSPDEVGSVVVTLS